MSSNFTSKLWIRRINLTIILLIYKTTVCWHNTVSHFRYVDNYTEVSCISSHVQMSCLKKEKNCWRSMNIKKLSVQANKRTLTCINMYKTSNGRNLIRKYWQDTLSDILLLATGRWLSPGPRVSFTNKSDRHDITEILLKVALNTAKQTNKNLNTIKTFLIILPEPPREILHVGKRLGWGPGYRLLSKFRIWGPIKPLVDFHKFFISCAAECPHNIYFIQRSGNHNSEI